MNDDKIKPLKAWAVVGSKTLNIKIPLLYHHKSKANDMANDFNTDPSEPQYPAKIIEVEIRPIAQEVREEEKQNLMCGNDPVFKAVMNFFMDKIEWYKNNQGFDGITHQNGTKGTIQTLLSNLWNEVGMTISYCDSDAKRHLSALTKENEELKASKDSAYKERNNLVAFLSKLYPSHLCRHSDEDKSWEDDWRWIVCIHSPQGQLTWHLHDSDVASFRHLVEQESHWDGHTTEEKYKRLAAIKSAMELKEGEV